MPKYSYKCSECGATEDRTHSMFDDSVQSCTECGAPLNKTFHATPVHFKGGGFSSDAKKGNFFNEKGTYR